MYLVFKAARQRLPKTIITTITQRQWAVQQGCKLSTLQGAQGVLLPPMEVSSSVLLLLLRPPPPREVSSPLLLLLLQQRRAFSLASSPRRRREEEGGAGGGGGGGGGRSSSVSRYPGGGVQSSTAQKVKEAGKDFTYLIVILVGLGVTGGLLYAVFQELFSASSPNTVYGKAFDRVKAHPEVIGAFGEPLKCYGEATRRQRRQHVSHVDYVKDGLKHMRIKFYIEGSEPGMKGTVHTESKENIETGKYEFRYIFVEVDTYPRRTIVVEDNR